MVGREDVHRDAGGAQSQLIAKPRKPCPYVEELCKVRGARFAGKSSAT